jgi:peptide-N4-(N-acetyl-beta-glucosaminyl)asparagine amidase
MWYFKNLFELWKNCDCHCKLSTCITLQTLQIPFLQRVRSHFQAVLRYEDKELQSKALALIPLKDFELAAEYNMRKLQRAIKSGRTKEQEVDIQEFILMELLSWFKNSFFSWVDSPECALCKGPTKFTGHSSNSTTEGKAYRTEVNELLR